MIDENSLPIVFVTQPVSKYNLITAQKYGKLRPVFNEGKQLLFSSDPDITKAEKILKDYKSDDYLLLIGDPSLIAISCSIAANSTQGKLRLLKYDRHSFSYYPVEINLKWKC